MCVANFFFYLTAVTDNYHTVSYKLLSAFRWLSIASKSTKNLEWILKLDDDVLLNVEAVKRFIQNIQDPKSIHCHIYNASLPFRRNSEEKW